MFSVIALVAWAIIVLPIVNHLWWETPQQDRYSADQTLARVRNSPPALTPLKLFTSTGRDEIARYCETKAEKRSDDWTHNYICDVKITDAYLGLFNLLLVIVTCGLIFVGFRTIKKMRDTEERQLRAYVLAAPGTLTKGFNNIWGFHVTLKNSGQTPAYDFTQLTASDVFNLPINETNFVVPREGVISRAVLPPGKETVTTLTHSLTPEEVAAVAAGTARFYVFGEIQFTQIGHSA